jgi:hypothetical protein
MSYANVESTILGILANVSGLSDKTVTAGDESVLDRGVTAAAIVYAGGLTTTPIQAYLSETSWTCNIVFLTRYTTAADTHTTFVALRDRIITALKTLHPDVANPDVANPYALKLESIGTAGDPQDVPMRGNPDSGPVFRAQTLTVSVVETDYLGA